MSTEQRLGIMKKVCTAMNHVFRIPLSLRLTGFLEMQSFGTITHIFRVLVLQFYA